MKSIIQAYIADQSKAWASTTLKSEVARLNRVAEVLNGNPEDLWNDLEKRKIAPYSRVTIWTRVTDLWNWGLANNHFEGSNPYKAWREKNARLFKHTYQRETPKFSLEEAKSRIAKIEDPAIRRKALELLSSGLRYAESLNVSPNGTVVGKGGKVRHAFIPQISGPIFTGNYYEFWKALSNVDLKPHTLRKLKATDLHRQGMDPVSLCQAMGWSSFETARSYLAPLQREAMEKFFK